MFISPRTSPVQTLAPAIAVLLVLHGSLPAVAANSQGFTVRGTLPWHNFLSGPTAWNEEDYERYLDRLEVLGLNFVGFH